MPVLYPELHSGHKKKLEMSYSYFSQVKPSLRKLMLAHVHRKLCAGTFYLSPFISLHLTPVSLFSAERKKK